MLDFRLFTFLTLCETMSYTKAADRLHLTQPAVTQHVKYLEREFGAPLFHYASKSLSLTQEGELLRQYAVAVRADSEKLRELIGKKKKRNRKLVFGATLTIGEYVLPEILSGYLSKFPDTDVGMQVNNTSTLLQRLVHGEIEFAFIEGNFNREEFESRLFSEERFIAVCAPSSPLLRKKVALSDLTKERLLLREAGSGTRNVLETVLYEHNLSPSDFRSVVEISNFAAIKKLAEDGLGVTFAYEEAVKEEIRQGKLCQLPISHFHVAREFNFVLLKHSVMKQEPYEFFEFCKNARKKEKL